MRCARWDATHRAAPSVQGGEAGHRSGPFESWNSEDRLGLELPPSVTKAVNRGSCMHSKEQGTGNGRAEVWVFSGFNAQTPLLGREALLND